MWVAQLDEYAGVPEDDPRSLYGWMRRSLCDPLGIGEERIIRLAPGGDPRTACGSYAEAITTAGGIDLAVLGLGPNGHLGFNEPPTDASVSWALHARWPVVRDDYCSTAPNSASWVAAMSSSTTTRRNSRP